MRTGIIKTAAERKKKLILASAALLYWLASFYLERFAFTPGAAAGRLFTYICVKLAALAVIYALLLFFTDALTGLRAKTPAAMTLIYTLPVFLLVTGFWSVTDSYPLTYGDQFNILNAAYEYSNMGGFFNYMTTGFFMVAMNIVPSGAFAVIFKIFAVSLAVGYCVFRMRRLTGSVWCLLLYLPFLLPPGLYLSYNIHRCPIYAPLYLAFSCLLICDHIEKRELTRGKFLLLCFVIAVLTQWRSEGIYLLVLGPILLYAAYRPKLSARQKAAAAAVMLGAQLIVFIPQRMETAASDSSKDRALPLYEYLITNMERKGLDKEKNAADLAIIDRYVSVDAIHLLNEENGDFNYGENLIIYGGLREGSTEQDKANFTAAVRRIVLKNFGVYLRTQLGAWSYITTEEFHDRRMDEISNIFQNLYVPTAWLLALWIYTLVKKKWCLWFMTSAHLGHMLITTALLPASYFKYYYSEYLYAIFTALLCLLLFIKGRKERA